MKVCSITPLKLASRYRVSVSDEEDSDNEDLFQRIFKCSKCSLGFNTRRQVQRHTRREHLKVRTRRRFKVTRNWRDGDETGGGDDDGEETDALRSLDSLTSGTGNDLTNAHLRKPLRYLSVVVERIRFVDIEVSSPSKGVREIHYTVEADTSFKKTRADTSSDSGTSSGSSSSSKYKDWRQVTIKALPKKVKSPEPPSVPKSSSTIPATTTTSCAEGNKSLFLELPSEFSFMFNVAGMKDDIHSILDVITGQKMRTVVLDAYLTLRLSCYNNEINVGIRNAYQLRPISSTRFHLLSVLFLPVFHRDQDPSTFQANLKLLPKEPLDEDCILIAPLYTCRHYYLAVFNCYTKSVYVYDSSWRYVPYQLRLEQVVRVLASVFPQCHYRWDIHFEFNCAQQIDEYSCGCYVIYFAENHLKNKSHRNSRNMNKAELMQLRADIVTELLPTTKTGSQFLEAITD